MNYKQTAELLFKEAEVLELHPKWLTDYGLFSVKMKGRKLYVYYSYSALNSHLSSRLAFDKHATRTILEDNSLPNIPYSAAKTKEEVQKIFKQQKVIIAKPTLSSHSENIYLIRSIDDIPILPYEDYIFEKYITGEEYRYLVLQNKVIAVHRKYYKTPINNPDTVKRISYPQKQWDPALISLALQVADAMHLSFAAVDFIIDQEGRAYVLEVNSAPGLWHFHHPSEGPSVNVALLFLNAMMANV